MKKSFFHFADYSLVDGGRERGLSRAFAPRPLRPRLKFYPCGGRRAPPPSSRLTFSQSRRSEEESERPNYPSSSFQCGAVARLLLLLPFPPLSASLAAAPTPSPPLKASRGRLRLRSERRNSRPPSPLHSVLSRSMSDVWREGLRKVGGRFQREGGRRERFLRETSESQLFSAAPPRALSKLHREEDMLGESLLHLPEGGGGGGEGGEGREGRERWRTLLPRMKKKKSGPTKALFFLPPPFYSAPAHLAIYSKRMEEGGGSTKATSED